eukprot:PITA_04358
MQKNDQTFSRFCEFKALVEKESGKKIRALRSDNGGEYVSQEFKDFCAAEGIKRELTAPHNPQKNGMAERKNRMINRSPHHILGMKTPEEAFPGKRPDVGHFRIFGSSVYCHVTKDARKKLKPTVELGTLAEEELLVSREEEPQTGAKQRYTKVPEVETSTQVESSRDGRKCSREADRLLIDARENVEEPSSQYRQRRSPDRYTSYMALIGECVEIEPYSFEEAVQQPVWVDAMVEEYDSTVRNSVWDVVPRPKNKSVVSSHWLYEVKGIDYDDTFAPVARYSSIRLMLALSAQMGWKIHQMDVKTAFLNGNIEEEVYIEKPKGFETFDCESHICRLKRDLYGLKQAPCAWYTRINNYFTGLGFTKSEVNVNLYHIMVEGKQLITVLYVGDLILTDDD